MKDFFISYTSADRKWAEWIAWQLKEAGYEVFIQAWDFRPQDNFIAEMDQAAREAKTTIAVLSPAYLRSRFTRDEWTVAFAKDTLLPVRIADFEVEGLLRVRVYIDLVNRDEAQAREELLKGINREPTRPTSPPPFPSAQADKPRFPGTLPPVWNVPRPPNPHFVGRDELLEEMQQTLLKGQAAALVALHGLGGIGKTQLAAEYAHAQHADYKVVWWLRAENEATLAEDLAALARALELREGEAHEVPVIVAAVLRWLNGNTGWLLVFDNADDPAAVLAYLPQNRQGHVLITSRAPNWRAIATSLVVETLDEASAAQFLLERTGQDSTAAEAAAKELAKELGGLPLALEQAAAYVEAAQETLAGYLELFRTRRRELWTDNQPPADYSATVATTWLIAFTEVEAKSEAAAELLRLCAYLGPDDIPLELLSAGAKHLPEALAACLADRLLFNQSIAELRRYSLIDKREDLLAVHRLVQAVTRDRLTAAEQQRWATAAVNIVNDAFPNEAHDVRNWPECEKLLSHAQVAAERSEVFQVVTAIIGRLFKEVGGYFFGRAQYFAAQKSFEHALQIVEAAFGPDHPDVAENINNLGIVLQALGKLDEARQCYDRALRIDEAPSALTILKKTPSAQIILMWGIAPAIWAVCCKTSATWWARGSISSMPCASSLRRWARIIRKP
jgi:tetratricopeptide (TPR) repeat protein